jgi:hypothetical protein
MTKRLPLLALILLVSSSSLFSQLDRLELGDNPTADKGALLDLSNGANGDKGFLIPRMTEAEKNSLTPVRGLQVYQTDGAKGFYFYNGSAWRPWRKPLSGEVDMTTGSSIVRGEGFTVTDEEVGRDLVTFDTPYANFPMIVLSGKTIEGQPPIIPGDICPQVMSNCISHNIRYLNVDYPIGGGYEFSTGNTFCSPSPGNLTTYKTADWIGSNVIPASATFNLNWNIYYAPSNRTGVYVDWDQDGSFSSAGEILLEETSASSLARNLSITVPATACNGYTTVRLVVIDSGQTFFSCEIPDSPNGETEQIEIEVTGGTNCVYQERQTNCNVAGLTTSDFRVECSDLTGKKVDAIYSFKIIDNQ